MKIHLVLFFVLALTSLQFAQWQEIPTDRFNDLRCIVKFDNQYFIGTDGKGIIRSTDEGVSWKLFNDGIDNSYFYLVVYSFYQAEDLYACTNLGLYRISSDEQRWTLIYSEPTYSFSKKDDIFIAGRYYDGLMTSLDGGQNWNTDRTQSFFNCAQAVFLDEKILVPSTSGLFVSTDNGLNWERRDSSKMYFGILQKGDSLIASRQDNVYLSTDEGKTWISFKGSSLGNKQVLYTVNKYFVLTNQSILCGSDYVERWINPNLGLTYNEKVWYRSTNYIDGYIYICTSDGLLKRNINEFDYPDIRVYDKIEFSKKPSVGETGYAHLSISNHGLDTLIITSIQFNDPNFQVHPTSIKIAPNWGYGVNITFTPSNPGKDSASISINSNALQGNISVVVNAEAIPVNYVLEQNYPNPFNPTTRINYVIEKTEHVKLEIFNSLGQKVQTLVDEIQSGGSKFVSFDASKLAAGIYYYRLTAGSFSNTKKMVLIK